MFPELSTLRRSTPAVETAMVLAPGLHSPVSLSLLNATLGADAEPNEAFTAEAAKVEGSHLLVVELKASTWPEVGAVVATLWLPT